MIPKTIHYCWFGCGEKPKLAQKCIVSWKKYCPDYEIIEWNEDNFDINLNSYTKMCYEQKKYAFLSDYVRLLAVDEYGGIYFDTDVEVIRPFDALLTHTAFFGFETVDYVNTGQCFGAEPNTEIVKIMIEEYDRILDGKKGVIGCPVLNTDALLKFGFSMNGKTQEKDGVTLYSKDYFNPFNDNTGILRKSYNTYSIHWYGKSWMDRKRIIRNKLTRVIHRMGFGNT